MKSFTNFGVFRKRKGNNAHLFTPEIKILFKQDEIQAATSKLLEIGLLGHHDFQKNWDLSLTVDVLNKVPKNSKIFDAGSGSKAVFGNSSYALGYRNVFASDLQNYTGTNIKFTREDISDTKYHNDFFDLVACHSVIEHGIDLRMFLQEMYRITRKNGCICVSTDFWPIEEDHSDKYPYGNDNPPMMLFNNASMRDFIEIAENIGWAVPTFEEIEPFQPRPITWTRMKVNYTFAWVCFVK